MDRACNITGDSETAAAGITSSGHHISVSLRREAPSPARPRICVRFRHGGVILIAAAYSTIVAGAAVLLRIVYMERYGKSPETSDYFVYNAGASAAARPPSLYLLPAPGEWLDLCATGLVCRGEAADFVVAHLRMVPAAAAAASPVAELLLFHDGKWRVIKRPRIIVNGDHGEDWDMSSSSLALWQPQAVVLVPLGGDGRRMLCWVDFARGVVVVSDVLDRRPTLRHVPYPVEAMKQLQHSRLVCTDARGAVKLVTVSLSPCHGCSDELDTTAVAAAAVDVWTLRTDEDGVACWVLETNNTMVDSCMAGLIQLLHCMYRLQ